MRPATVPSRVPDGPGMASAFAAPVRGATKRPTLCRCTHRTLLCLANAGSSRLWRRSGAGARADPGQHPCPYDVGCPLRWAAWSTAMPNREVPARQSAEMLQPSRIQSSAPFEEKPLLHSSRTASAGNSEEPRVGERQNEPGGYMRSVHYTYDTALGSIVRWYRS